MDKQSLKKNELIQAWFTQNLQIIGEAARVLSPEIRSQYPEISWSNMIEMRNILAHNYFEIDLEIVWAVVEQDLPVLKPKIENMLQEQ